jgi:hypothetical protein
MGTSGSGTNASISLSSTILRTEEKGEEVMTKLEDLEFKYNPCSPR